MTKASRFGYLTTRSPAPITRSEQLRSILANSKRRRVAVRLPVIGKSENREFPGKTGKKG